MTLTPSLIEPLTYEYAEYHRVDLVNHLRGQIVQSLRPPQMLYMFMASTERWRSDVGWTHARSRS